MVTLLQLLHVDADRVAVVASGRRGCCGPVPANARATGTRRSADAVDGADAPWA